VKQKESNAKWIIEAFIITFILSGLISYISSNGVSKLNIFWAVIILLLVIVIGIIFDIIGVAVTVADENHFHAKATKKVEGSKASLKLIKNASKVANICADVIGDICGVLSGAISTMLALKIIENYGFSENIQFFVSALVASITVSGKAFGKNIATKKSTEIVHRVGIILNRFLKE
jgi:CBS domain containing-hemolysin-like protein